MCCHVFRNTEVRYREYNNVAVFCVVATAVSASRALVKKWFDFARRYRRLVTSDFITLQVCHCFFSHLVHVLSVVT